MLDLNERIELTDKTLSFIMLQIKTLEKKVHKTSDPKKLELLMGELQGWNRKCDHEGQVIKKLYEEAGETEDRGF